MFRSKQDSEVNDFYDSVQAIQDSYENNEGFGRFVPEVSNFKQSFSYSGHNAGSFGLEPVKNSFSSQSFQENEYHSFFGNAPYNYDLEDHSTMASLSSVTSFNSPSSQQSVTKSAKKSKNKKSKKNMNGKKKNSEHDYKKKYKTELCKHLTEKGFCEFGDQCAFAHNPEEVRQKQHISSNYKTQKCKQFHQVGYCRYGLRCQFIHCFVKDSQFNPALEEMSYNDAIENAELWTNCDADCVCMQKKKAKSRLPSFKNLACEEGSCCKQEQTCLAHV